MLWGGEFALVCNVDRGCLNDGVSGCYGGSAGLLPALQKQARPLCLSNEEGEMEDFGAQESAFQLGGREEQEEEEAWCECFVRLL